MEKLLDGEAEALTRKAIAMALAGDTTARRLCIDRICPVRKGRAQPLDLPKIESVADLARAQGAIVGAMAAGELSAEEASDASKVIEAVGASLDRRDFEVRLAALEAKGTAQ